MPPSGKQEFTPKRLAPRIEHSGRRVWCEILGLSLLLAVTANLVSQSILDLGCARDISVLKDPDGKPVWLGPEELVKRAVRRVDAKIPPSLRVTDACIPVEVLVDTDGKVCCTRPTQGHLLLKQAAEEAAKQWIFEPLVRDGKRFPYLGTLVFSFTTTPGKNACGALQASLRSTASYKLASHSAK